MKRFIPSNDFDFHLNGLYFSIQKKKKFNNIFNALEYYYKLGIIDCFMLNCKEISRI